MSGHGGRSVDLASADRGIVRRMFTSQAVRRSPGRLVMPWCEMSEEAKNVSAGGLEGILRLADGDTPQDARRAFP